MKVTILGTEYECRPLSAADRLDWNLYLHYECQKTFYSDLHRAVEYLPMALQVEVFRKHSPPARLDASMPLYYRNAFVPSAVRFLLDMVLVDVVLEVTKDNSTEIFLAVKHLIFEPKPPPVVTDTEEKQAEALETFANLERSE